ncbi:MAG: hypothetical protein QXO72_04450, partial [Sulfolobales archaeon]
MYSSRIAGFYKLSVDERAKIIKELVGLTDDELNLIRTSKMGLSLADKMIENVIGTFELPLGVATNFLINNKDYLIPMVIEEPSVVAAASNAARMCREGGGLFAISTESIMFSQIQLVGVASPHTAIMKILQNKDEILRLANEKDPILNSLG